MTEANNFIKEELECLEGERVVFFVRGGIHVEGTVEKIKEGFIVLVTTVVENVEVESNASGILLEPFKKFFLRLHDIVGFGRELDTSN